jgi:hypothetical protein
MTEVYRGFGSLEFSFNGEPAVIAKARKNSDIDQTTARNLVFAFISNRKVFDAIWKNGDDDYTQIAHAVSEVLDGLGLYEVEVENALADYDKIMGIKPAKSETEIKIDKLQAELDSTTRHTSQRIRLD